MDFCVCTNAFVHWPQSVRHSFVHNNNNLNYSYKYWCNMQFNIRWMHKTHHSTDPSTARNKTKLWRVFYFFASLKKSPLIKNSTGAFFVFVCQPTTDSMISTIGYSLGKNDEAIDKRLNGKKNPQFFFPRVVEKHEKGTQWSLLCLFLFLFKFINKNAQGIWPIKFFFSTLPIWSFLWDFFVDRLFFYGHLCTLGSL